MRLTLTPLSEADAAALIGESGDAAPAGQWVIRWLSKSEGICYVLDAGTIYRVTVEETAK